MKNVFTNGNFDLLHSGHINLLTHCRCLAGRYGKVIVGLDTDVKIQHDKGTHRPYFNQGERINNLLSLKYPVDSITYNLVDEIRLFNTNKELYDLIKLISPMYLVKGSDWKNNVIGSDLTEVLLFDRQGSWSSSDIERRIIINNKQKTKFDPTV